jgi:hypothetical protein
MTALGAIVSKRNIRRVDEDREDTIKRLLSNAIIGGPDSCWEWTALKVRKGYGVIRYNGKKLRAHRLSYELHCGPIPAGLFVCHRCDNRGCINPSHLFLGTNTDNMRDMVSKGRHRLIRLPGERNGQAKLTEAEARAILASKGKVRQEDLAERYGVSQSRISSIMTGKNWAHLTEVGN